MIKQAVLNVQWATEQRKSWHKVQLFWEGHTNLLNLPHGFDVCHEEDYANLCGLLRKAECNPDLPI